nr:NADH dehydrogenase subunit 3 [Vesperus sanzi]
MKTIMFIAELIMMIMLILVIILNLVSKKSIMDREKSSPFECGFDPKNNARLPFSLQFFLIAVIFLIFDVEITLLLPMILLMKITNNIQFAFIMIFFMVMLLLGLYHEWNQGALNWAY